MVGRCGSTRRTGRPGRAVAAPLSRARAGRTPAPPPRRSRLPARGGGWPPRAGRRYPSASPPTAVARVQRTIGSSVLGCGHAGDGEPALPAIGGVELIQLLARLPEWVGGVPTLPVFAALPGADNHTLLRLALWDQHLQSEPTRLLLGRL